MITLDLSSISLIQAVKKEILDEINRILKVHSKTKSLYNNLRLSRLILLKNKELCVEYTIIDSTI